LTLTRYRSAFGLDGSRLRHYQATARAFPDVSTSRDLLRIIRSLTAAGITGSLNVEVGPDPHQAFSGKVGEGNIHIVATWSCAAGL
jgi:hypothetical protein